jgi:hypothetical protein
MKKIHIKQNIINTISGISFFILLLSITFYMLHWRVINEPGFSADSYPILKIGYLASFWFGIVAVFVINVYTLTHNPKKIWQVWVVNAGAGGLYIPIFGITLFMMA